MDDTDATILAQLFTDAELRARWKCSRMKLHRLRATGTLQSFKLGGVGKNMTFGADVLRIEKGAE